MKLTVENLGAISKAEIDLSKDLIIFTGENNTGKTYLATVLYLLFNEIEFDIPDELIAERDFDTPSNQIINLIEIKEELKDQLSQFLVNSKLKHNLGNLFATKKTNFVDAKFNLSFTKQDISDQHLLDLELNFGKKVSNPQWENDQILFYYKEKGSPLLELTIKNSTFIDLQSFALTPLNKILERVPFIIPAERQGINLFHKELSLIKNKTFDSLLQNGSREKLFSFLQTRFNKYALPIKDSLEFNQNLDAIKTQKGEYAYLADELDHNFLQGNIKIDDEGDISFKPENSKKSLDFHLTSSTVKSLSSLSIYLRYVAKKGDFIIIDEPELNLHPDNQRKIARFISRLINEGFKVMISTHSDYIIRELNSLIMLSSGKEKNPEQTKELQKKYKYKDEELLSKNKVGVYIFKQNKPVKKIRVSNTGFDISTIDKEVEKLNQSSQDIFFTLFE